jgi:hypothetical protein
VTLSGFGTFALTESRLADANLDAEILATDALWAHVNAGRSAPDLLIPRTSIFSVFAAERRDELGGGLSLRKGRWQLLGDYHFVAFDDDGTPAERDGHEALLKVSVRPTTASTVGAQGKILFAPVNGYYEGRLWGSQRIVEPVTVTVDLDYFHFENPVNGHSDSYVASVTGAWNFAPGWMAAVTGLGSVTPFFEQRLEVLGKLIYNFSTRQEVKP